MPTDPDDASLILGNGEQLNLIPGEELDQAGLPASAYADAEARGRFTGERLFSSNPKLYRAIAKLLARGETYREIADICQVSTQTVTGVAYREAIPVETLRERLGRVGFDVARLSLEALLELLSDPVTRAKISAKDLAVIHGIAFNNAQLALGGATARVELRDIAEPGHADYLRMVQQAEQAAAQAKEPKNVTGTGSCGETPETKGAALPAPDAAGSACIDLDPAAHAKDAEPLK